jgi:ATP phosphoribosyltransferase regulatory subunit
MAAMVLEHPLPSGMRDLLPEDARARRLLARSALEQASLFGYELVMPPPFEFAEVLERGLGALDPAEVLRFVEPESGEVAALRPDMTPQIARMIATRLQGRPPPHRLAYEGTVLRRRGGRAMPRRQIPQVGVELAGIAGEVGDVEILEVLAAALRGAGLSSFAIDVGDSGVVRGLLEGASDEAQRALLGALAQRDETRIRDIGKEHGFDVSRLLDLVRLGGDARALEEGRKIVHQTPAAPAAERLCSLASAASERGLGQWVSIDLGEVRDFAYYTSTLIHVYAPGPGHAIAAGGRYDDLLERFGAKMPAVGFAIDLDALATALRAAGRMPEPNARALVPRSRSDLAARLRAAGIACAVHVSDDLEAHAKAWGYVIVRDEAQAQELITARSKSG